jgi:glycine cleavage system aminomethyltransferase T
MGYLPIEIAKKNTGLEIEINGKYCPASVIKEPLYDPSGSKMRS